MPPRIGRSNYNDFRANEVILLAREIVELARRKCIHETRNGSNGRPPMRKRDMIVSMLFLEAMRCPVPEAPGLLTTFRHVLRLEKVPGRSTIYKYRAARKMTRILEDLQPESSEELWKKETIAAVDSTGNSRTVGKAWSNDRSNPSEFRKYDKAHYLSGTKTSVIRSTRLTSGNSMADEGRGGQSCEEEQVPGGPTRRSTQPKEPGVVPVHRAQPAVHTHGPLPHLRWVYETLPKSSLG